MQVSISNVYNSIANWVLIAMNHTSYNKPCGGKGKEKHEENKGRIPGVT